MSGPRVIAVSLLSLMGIFSAIACSDAPLAASPSSEKDATSAPEDGSAASDGSSEDVHSEKDAIAEDVVYPDAGPKTVLAAHGTIVVDGLATDPVWASAPGVTFDTDYSGKSTGVFTTVKFSWSTSGLAMFADVSSTDLFVDQTKSLTVDRPKLYDEDCVELFFTPTPKTPNRYYEIELGPYGHFLDLAVDLDAATYDTSFSSGLVVKTVVDKPGRHASIEAIFTAKEITSVLAAATAYRIGLFRLEGKTTDPGGRLFLAHSPPKTAKPNFHVPSAFGTLVLLP